MPGFTLDEAVIAALPHDPSIARAVDDLGEQIHRDARENIIRMHAVDTGRLLGSGFSERDGDEVIIGFQVDYAKYVEFGEGGDRYVGPRPFLQNAAFKQRGVL